MDKRLDVVMADENFRRQLKNSGVVPGLDLDAGGLLDPRQEAIALLAGRPSLLVRRGRFEVPSSGIWAPPLMASRSLVEARLPAVGRIEVDDGSGFRHFGSGWLIAERVVATTRRVAEKFALRRADGSGQFLVSFLGKPYGARIDFREESGVPGNYEVGVEKVVFMETPDRQFPDIALLELVPGKPLPPPIPLLDGDPERGGLIVVVGYAALDLSYGLDEREASKAAFGSLYGVKRLSPGRVLGRRSEGSWFFEHDATTLGGHSGSVLLDLKTGLAVGMHFQGEFRGANYAVNAKALLERAAACGLTVSRRRTEAMAEVGEAGETELAAGSDDYGNRKGFDPKFLGTRFVVPLPGFSSRVKPEVLTFGTQNERLLHYTHFSVAMNKPRRMCFYSAVNINGKQSQSIQGARPSWRLDRRIPATTQVLKECYGREASGKFSRGHMTRREDPNWGDLSLAQVANEDTFHATNACPQMQPFNAGVWNNLEDYALQNAKQDDMKISVFTGPVYGGDDPELFGVKIPVRFWKVIAFIHDQTGALCATGYLMSQKDFLPGEEFVYGSYESYQVRLEEIELLSGLTFGTLTARDPLKTRGDEAPIMIPLRSNDEIMFR